MRSKIWMERIGNLIDVTMTALGVAMLCIGLFGILAMTTFEDKAGNSVCEVAKP